MKAGDIMTTGAATVRSDAPLTEAARLLLEYRIGGLPVVDADGRLVGIVTEHDFLRKIGGERPRWLDVLLTGNGQLTRRELQERRVEDVMSSTPVSVTVETPIGDLLDLMHRQGVKRVPVVANEKVVGIVSRANLLEALMRKAR